TRSRATRGRVHPPRDVPRDRSGVALRLPTASEAVYRNARTPAARHVRVGDGGRRMPYPPAAAVPRRVHGGAMHRPFIIPAAALVAALVTPSRAAAQAANAGAPGAVVRFEVTRLSAPDAANPRMRVAVVFERHGVAPVTT